jgi:hypothetical protein
MFSGLAFSIPEALSALSTQTIPPMAITMKYTAPNHGKLRRLKIAHLAMTGSRAPALAV